MSLRVRVRSLIALAISIGLTHAAQAAPIFNLANGHYYEAFAISGGITWEEANAAATSLSYLGMSGHLATATSAEENQFIEDNLNMENNYFLGGFQPLGSPEPDGGWQWVTGELWDFTNWNTGEPNNGGRGEMYLHFYNGAVWNDVPGDYQANGYIVEYSPAAVPEPSTLFLSGSGVLAMLGYSWLRRSRKA